jgi:hypothetical protein
MSSTSEQKVEVVTEWLQRTARKQRMTNLREVQLAAGLALAEKGYRENGSCRPITEDEVVAANAEIAKASFEQDGFLLPALQIHFGDKKPSSRFTYWAAQAGLLDQDVAEDPEVTEALHAEHVAKIHKHYANVTA